MAMYNNTTTSAREEICNEMGMTVCAYHTSHKCSSVSTRVQGHRAGFGYHHPDDEVGKL